MTYDLFRVIEIKTHGFDGVAYTLNNLIIKYENKAKPGQLFKVWGIGVTRNTENDDSGNYEAVENNGKIEFIKTNKEPNDKWVPLHFYTDHETYSSLIYSGEEKESHTPDYVFGKRGLNRLPYIVTESGYFLKDMIMNDSNISKRGIPNDCSAEYRNYLTEDDSENSLFCHKYYITYATLSELSAELEKLEQEWKAEILNKVLENKNDNINEKLDLIINLIRKQPIITQNKQELTNTEEEYWDDEPEDIILNRKYWLIQNLYKEIEGISMFVNSATAQYKTNSSIRICYWVE